MTGAGRGIGAGIAERLAADGMQVVGIDRAPGTDLTLDVTDRTAVHEALGALDRIDVVVNCAMWIRYEHIEEVDEETVDGMLAVGLKSCFWTTQAALPKMRAQGGGVIVHMASPAALHGFPTAGVYSAIKGAVAAFTRQSAVELAPDNVRVNAVVPGAIPRRARGRSSTTRATSTAGSARRSGASARPTTSPAAWRSSPRRTRRS